MAGSLKELTTHRFCRAKEELATAELLLKNKMFRSSINRSYYSSKHSGVISHFNQEYVKTGKISKEASKVIRHASELREQADYEDFYEATEEEAREAYFGARQFISAVSAFLENQQDALC